MLTTSRAVRVAGTQAVPLAAAAETLAAFCAAVPGAAAGHGSAEAIESTLATLDWEGSGLLTPELFARVVAR